MTAAPATTRPVGERFVGWLRTFRPVRPAHRWIEFARGGLGGLAGIIVASAFVRAVGVGVDGLPYIVAPIGASAVLVFAVPASPLAQPFPVLLGNTLSAAVGIASAKVFDDKTVYPDQATMSRLFVITARDQATQRIINRLWTRVKTGR